MKLMTCIIALALIPVIALAAAKPAPPVKLPTVPAEPAKAAEKPTPPPVIPPATVKPALKPTAATQPTTATQPTATSQPAATTKPADCVPCREKIPPIRPTAEADAVKILVDLELAGQKYKTIKADIVLSEDDRMLGESKQQTGWVAYQKLSRKATAKFRVHFDSLQLGDGPRRKELVDHAFDGQFWTIAKHGIKHMERYQVAAEGEDIEPLKLGKGPFPLPFGQKAADVILRFEVTTRPFDAKLDPANTRYLKLVPRKEHRNDIPFKQAEMWIDGKTQLPVKLVSRDKKKLISTVTFGNLQTNIEIDAVKMFHIPRPAGWTYKVEPLNK